MPQFRIVDLRAAQKETEHKLDAQTPEAAAGEALGMHLFRSGAKRDLICRVYWQSPGGTNMVRLYGKTLPSHS
ncbi:MULTISPECIES: hypothetical protein [unclassified Devosia]|uniref:hypothetical protein n=1 Tax=unclassified Devosia TaxID=196773 RepID=UPI00145D2D32|nr:MULTISPECIES: hypothetical protein [unclassified Devosia]MBJ6988740.1 hypothetical protein [Devosia sp. MC521]MBJ7579290.1 hypothetical protein [Devosia sp. MC532]MBK1796219.1 hypothetical protein [Devosia sp. WQ 349K1]QMW63123.1 hypothetical protein H4N61_01845 [Devosia sp. MC521]